MMSERISAPVVFGGFRPFRPVIVLPASICDSGDRTALRFCLAHEWSHVERGDLRRWNLTAFAQLVLFYQPLFWWLRRQIRLSQDYLADARAAEQADSIDYAEFLVGLARRQMTPPALALSIADHRSHLTRRVHMLLLNREPFARRCRTVWTAAACSTALALLCLVASIRFAAADPAPQSTSTIPASDEKKDHSAPQAEAKNQAGPKVEQCAIPGQVVDKGTGKPISAATVTIQYSLEQMMDRTTEIKCQTDAEGKYSFTVALPSDRVAFFYQAKVEHPDYAPMHSVRINHGLGSPAKPVPLTKVELSAGEQVMGVVHTPEGKPASGVKVVGYSTPPHDNQIGRRPFPLYSSLAQASTDAAGKFSLRMLGSNAKEAVLWIVAEESAPSAQVLKDKRGDLGTITLQPGVKLRGRLVDAKGKPVPGVYVNMRSPDPVEGMTDRQLIYFMKRAVLTNEKGEFAMQPVPPGKYLVQPREAPVEIGDDVFQPRKRAELPALFVESQVNLKPGVVPEPLEIKAVPHVVVEAQFFDAQGKPIPGPAARSHIRSSRIHGRLDDGTSWDGMFKEAPDGKLTAVVPHGLENAELITGAPVEGFAWRKGKDGKLHEPEAIDLSRVRNIPLGTLTEDVMGIDFVQRGERLKYSGKVVNSSTGKPIEGATVTVRRFILEDPERKGQKRPAAPRGSPADVQTKYKTDAEGNYSFFIQPGQSAQRHLYLELTVEHPDYAGKRALGDALSTIRQKEKAGEPLFFSKIELSPAKSVSPAPKK
jgi:protocatechuate 3,4-dioxygenase beta subunit